KGPLVARTKIRAARSYLLFQTGQRRWPALGPATNCGRNPLRSFSAPTGGPDFRSSAAGALPASSTTARDRVEWSIITAPSSSTREWNAMSLAGRRGPGAFPEVLPAREVVNYFAVRKEGAGRPPLMRFVHAEAEEFRRLFRDGFVLPETSIPPPEKLGLHHRRQTLITSFSWFPTLCA